MWRGQALSLARVTQICAESGTHAGQANSEIPVSWQCATGKYNIVELLNCTRLYEVLGPPPV